MSSYHYLISNTLLADFLKVSISTAYSYKQAAGKADFIVIDQNKQYFPGISQMDRENHLKELKKHNPRLRADSKGCFEFGPDLIKFKIKVKKKKKIEIK